MSDNLRKDLMSYADKAAAREAQKEEASRFVEIVALNAGQRYDVQGTDQDGVTEYVSNSVPETQWQLGQWVVIEYTGLDWSITGISPWAGESTAGG